MVVVFVVAAAALEIVKCDTNEVVELERDPGIRIDLPNPSNDKTLSLLVSNKRFIRKAVKFITLYPQERSPY